MNNCDDNIKEKKQIPKQYTPFMIYVIDCLCCYCCDTCMTNTANYFCNDKNREQ